MKLKVRVVHYRGAGCWYADIDDADDRQPDDPYWYADGCRTHAEALAAACTQLGALDQAIAAGIDPVRISGSSRQPAGQVR